MSGKTIKEEPKMSEQQMQQKYLEYQMIEAQTKQIHKQISQIDAQAQEIENVNECIEAVNHPDAKRQMFVPLSAGVYVNAELTNTNEFIVNVGSNVFVKKTVAETKGLILKQKDELERVRAQMLEEYAISHSKLQILEQEIMRLTQDASNE